MNVKPAEIQRIINELSTEHNPTAIENAFFEKNIGNIRALLNYCDIQRDKPYVSKACAELEYRLITQSMAQEKYIPLNGDNKRDLTPEQEKKYVMDYLNTEGKQFYCDKRTWYGSKQFCTPFLESLNCLMTQCGAYVAQQYQKQQQKENTGFLAAVDKILNKGSEQKAICQNTGISRMQMIQKTSFHSY